MKAVIALFSFFLICCGSSEHSFKSTPPKIHNLWKNISAGSPLVQKLSQSVVRITAGGQEGTAFGTGFFISSKGLLLTNTHVIDTNVCYKDGCLITLTLDFAFGDTPKNEVIFAKPLNYNPQKEIHILETFQVVVDKDSKKLKPTALYYRPKSHIDPLTIHCHNASELMDQEVFYIGHPSASLKKFSATKIVSKRGSFASIDTPVLGGSSGSPVFLMNGRLVGIIHGGTHSTSLSGWMTQGGEPSGNGMMTTGLDLCENFGKTEVSNLSNYLDEFLAFNKILEPLKENELGSPENFNAHLKLLRKKQHISTNDFLNTSGAPLNKAASFVEDILLRDIFESCKQVAQKLTTLGALDKNSIYSFWNDQTLRQCRVMTNFEKDVLEKIAPEAKWISLIRTIVEYQYRMFHDDVDFVLEAVQIFHKDSREQKIFLQNELARLWELTPKDFLKPYDVYYTIFHDFPDKKSAFDFFRLQNIDLLLKRENPLVVLKIYVIALEEGWILRRDFEDVFDRVYFNKNLGLDVRFTLEELSLK